MYRLSKDQTPRQIRANSNGSRRSCCDLNMSDLAADRHLGFNWKWIFTILWHILHQHDEFQHSGPMCGWVIDDSVNVHDYSFSGSNFTLLCCLRVERSDLNQIWGENRSIIGALNAPFAKPPDTSVSKDLKLYCCAFFLYRSPGPKFTDIVLRFILRCVIRLSYKNYAVVRLS